MKGNNEGEDSGISIASRKTRARRARGWECCQRRTARCLLTRRVDGAPVQRCDDASWRSLASRRDEAGVGVGVGGWAAARNVRVDVVGSEGEAWRISRAVASYSSMCQLAERDSGAVRDR